MIEALTGYRIDERFDTLVTVLFLVLLFWGVRHLASRAARDSSKAEIPQVGQPTTTPSIQGDYNTYINIAAEQLSVTPEQVEQAVESVAKGPRRQTLTRAAIDLMRPAKRGGNSRIVPRGTPEISSQTVAEFPDDIALADLDEGTEVEHYPEARLEIRALDKDKADRGWAGRLSARGMKTKRVGVKLYPTVDREGLAHVDSARVEAMLETKTGPDGEPKPVQIHVLRVLDAETPTRTAEVIQESQEEEPKREKPRISILRDD